MKRKRLTLNRLKDLCNEYLERVDASVRITEIYRTRYRSHEYEGGAAFFNLKMQEPESEHYYWVHIFYPLSYLEDEINKGHKMIFKERYRHSGMEGEFDISQYPSPHN